jgi:serine protease AprX
MGNLENMMKSPRVNKITSAILIGALAFTAAAWGISNYSSGEEYILQGASRPALVSAIQAENGVIIHEFKLIQAVSAKLTDKQVQGIASRNAMIRFFNEANQVSLSASRKMRLMQDSPLSQNAPRNSQIPLQIGASELHKVGITGKGVTVAIIDSGLGQFSALNQNTTGRERNITVVNSLGEDASGSQDLNGHGSHMASILADSTGVFDQYGAPTGAHSGVAPDVDLVMIKAFDEEGEASYSSVLQGIEYAIENRDSLNIRVLNVAFSFPATSFYWEDPINQALMRAWNNGITVIAPAGNGNNKDMSVGVPGNNPYVITVGAMDDNSTPFDTSDDIVASFSSFGPTVEGFMKPEVLAPGTNVKGLVAQNSRLADKNETSGVSGTSQATAVTAGVVALMIQQDPSLTPDEIKCRLMSSASQAKKQNGELAFSVFAQGAGLINASAAINTTVVGCANSGLNIANDINLRSHYFGPAKFDERSSEFTLGENKKAANGVIWNNDIVKSDEKSAIGVIWNNDIVKSANGVIWNNDIVKSANGVIWNNDIVKSDKKVANGVIWNNDIVKSDKKVANGVIWNNDIVKSDKKVANGVIWNNDIMKSDKKVANGVIWNNDIVKSDKKVANGVIWNNDIVKSDKKVANGVIWNNDIVKSDKKVANGVIWNNDIVKSDKKVANGVIWNNDIVKSDKKVANGVIWNNDIVKSDKKVANGVIWNNDIVKSDKKVANGVIWNNDIVKSDKKLSNGVIWNNDIVKSDKKLSNGVIWNNDIVKSDKKVANGVIWNNDIVKTANGVIWNNDIVKTANGVIWNNDIVKSDKKVANGVIWNNDIVKSDKKIANGVIWNNDIVKSDKKVANGVIWNNDIVKSDKKVANGVIWNNDIVKSDTKVANGVIWNNDIVKSDKKVANGVIWNNDIVKSTNGVIWNNDIVKSDEKSANGVIWNNDIVKSANGVIWNNDIVKSDKKSANGVIWNNDIVKSDKKSANGVIWNNDIVKSDKKIANGVIWNNDIVKSDKKIANGVIWNNDIVKSDKNVANGVIWNNDIVKSDKKIANGVIWNNDILVKSGPKDTQGVIWHKVTEVTHALTAEGESGLSDTSPQVKLIRKWATETDASSSTESNDVIKLDILRE